MNYSYKLLTGADVPLFKALLNVFGQAFEEVETYQGKVPSDAYLKSLLEKDHFITLVVLSDREVVGGLTAYVLEKFEQERKEVYIYDLAVSVEHRRKGLATGLIEELKRIAKEKGAYVIFVQADLEDAPAIQLYESIGVREDVLHFDIGME